MSHPKLSLPIALAWSLLLAPPTFPTPASAGSLATEPNSSCLILRRSGNSGNLCSGALIGPDLVLTAAHCFSKDKPSANQDIRVSCGPVVGPSGNLTGTFVEEFKVKAYKLDPGYRGNADRDFALIVTDKPAKILAPLRLETSLERLKSDLFQNAPLGAGTLVLKPDVQCRFTGYGSGKGGGPEYKNIDMSPSFGVNIMLQESAMYLQRSDRHPMKMKQGDSGGAFRCRKGGPDAPWTVVGVLSGCYVKSENDSICPADSAWGSVVSEEFLDFLAGTRRAWLTR